MRFLRSNTAVIITVGPFYDKTDGVTIETALTISNERITLTADTDAGSAPTNILDNVTGATSGTANDLNYITGNDAGMMQLELAAADTNRVGRMFLSITDAANHVPVFHEFFVLPAAIYDWLTAGAAPLTPTTAGRTLDVSATGEAGVDWANVGGQSTSVNLSATTTNLVNTVTTYTGNTLQTGDSFARIGVAGAGLTNIDLPDQTMNITGNITGNLSGSVGSVTGAVGSVTGAVGSVTGAVGSVTGLTAADVGTIKAKTDSLTFTVAGKVDANITHVIADPVQASSSKTTNWGGTP